MYEQSLTQAGLTEEMAQIYELLLKQGPQSAGKLAKKSGLKRGLTYKTLERLLEKHLIEKSEEDAKVAVFTASHPLKLQDMIEARQQRAKNAQLAVENILPSLVSEFNLLIGRPGVEYYEGIEGLKKVWWDSLKSKTPIYTIGDLEMVIRDFSSINGQYLEQRKKLGIKKMAIVNGSDFNRQILKDYDRELTDIKIVEGQPEIFPSIVMEIYDNKISYTTLKKNSIIAIVIEDEIIYRMSKNLFEYLFATLPSGV